VIERDGVVRERAFITGGTGFVGQWLARLLLAEGFDVVSLGLHRPTAGVLAPNEEAAIEWVHGDIRDDNALYRALDRASPDFVFHLAGISYVPEARDAPALTYEVNVLGAVRLLAEIARRRSAGAIDPVVLVIGSATQYGPHPISDMPLTEDADQRPADVYAASKAAQEIAARQICRADGLRVICTRSFNHSGAGHPEHFLLPALVRRVIALRSGRGELRLGNRDSVRDYLHVEDVTRAYLSLAQRGTPGEVYNVCSGEGVSAGDLARDVLLRVGTTAEITTDPALVRGVDVPVLVGSPAKLHQATGWRPTRTRADIIDDLIHAATR
jgi:GDP-4-dehydro-6-deoxy-D-mannose reductase